MFRYRPALRVFTFGLIGESAVITQQCTHSRLTLTLYETRSYDLHNRCSNIERNASSTSCAYI